MTIKKYVVTRILAAIPMWLLLITTVFIVMHVIPGDPIKVLYGERITPEKHAELLHELGLDRPIHIQFFDYMNGLFHGDLGMSVHYRRPVIDYILKAFPCTLEFTIASMLMSLLVGIPLGIIGALKRNKVPDRLIGFFSLVSWALPIFFLGMLVQLGLAVGLPIFPLQGRSNPTHTIHYITGFATIDTLIIGDFGGFLDVLGHLFLPALTLTIAIAASISRISRANMIEVMGEDYILAARAKGLTESKVVYKHAFRNAILPIFTITGMYFALLLGGSVLTETIFSLPGMGKLLVDSIFRRDYSMIQGCVVIYATAVMAITTIIDIVYVFLDPRIRY